MDHFGNIADLPQAPSLPPPTGLDKNWLLARISMVLAGYRKTDYHNLEAFMTQAAINLMRFPKDIIEYVSLPIRVFRHGYNGRQVWPKSLRLALPSGTPREGRAVFNAASAAPTSAATGLWRHWRRWSRRQSTPPKHLMRLLPSTADRPGMFERRGDGWAKP